MRRNSSVRRNPHAPALRLAILLLILGGGGALAVISPVAAATIGRDEAVSLVTETQLGGTLDGIRLYVSPQALPAGQTVSSWKREVFRTPAPGWFIFVDRHPRANWEHACSYFFVDASTAEVQRYDAMVPPRTRSELTEITHGRDNPDPGVSEAALARYSERLRGLPKPKQSRGQAYAFIISGGADASNNHIRYWNDCAFIYRTLVDYYGYADDHIRVCISDGTSTAADRSDGTNSPTDLDGDGDADTEYPATLQYVDQVFDELAASLTATDQLFIFTTDHGGQESGHDCYLNLWSWQELRDDQMAGYVAALPCETIICTFEQCFSGGMVDDLQGDGRVIATAANWNEYSWAMGPDYVYDTFVYYWTSAVGWEMPNGTPVDADTNNDTMVSMHEAFIYAQSHDNEDETPQYSSTPADLGDILNLFGNMEGVYLTLDQITIDDDNEGASQGNGNGMIDFGERIELFVALHNLGLSEGPNVIGTLVSGSPHVTMITGEVAYGPIPSEGTVANGQPFVFDISDAISQGDPLEMVLNVNEVPSVLPLDLSAQAPTYTASITGVDDSSGDGDGVADPGETVWLTVRIDNSGGVATPDLTVTLQGEGYFVTDGSTHHVGAILPGQSVTTDGGMVQVSPLCPDGYAGFLVLEMTGPDAYEVPYNLLFCIGPWTDNAESDMGWSLGVPGDDATSGQWVREEPVGTVYNGQQAQPEYDHTEDPASLCFVTGNGVVGGGVGAADVDAGKTTLLSPVFDAAGATTATFSYWRWYTNNLGNNPGTNDYWSVEVTADGTNWVYLEHTLTNANQWTYHFFDLEGIVPLTGMLQFRFVVQDPEPVGLVEAAVDDIAVTIEKQSMSAVPATGSNGGFPAGIVSCRPNPLRQGALLTYRLGSREAVRIELFDTAGRRVRTVWSGQGEPGEHTLSFPASDSAGRPLVSGIYFLRMDTPSRQEVRQVTVLR